MCFRDLSWGLEINSNILVRNYFFLKNYVTSERESESFLTMCYIKSSPTRYQVSFLLTMILSHLPKVSIAFRIQSNVKRQNCIFWGKTFLVLTSGIAKLKLMFYRLKLMRKCWHRCVQTPICFVWFVENTSRENSDAMRGVT